MPHEFCKWQEDALFRACHSPHPPCRVCKAMHGLLHAIFPVLPTGVAKQRGDVCLQSDACSPPCRSPYGCCKSARDAQLQSNPLANLQGMHSFRAPSTAPLCRASVSPSHLTLPRERMVETARRENSSATSAATREPTSASTPVSITMCSDSSTHHCVRIASFSACLSGSLGTVGGDTLSQTGCPLPPPPPQNGMTASETSPVLCSRERKVQPLPCTPMGAESCPSAQWIPKAAPQNKSPRGEAGLALTSGTGCRDKLSGGCRALRRRRHPPTLWGKGSSGSPVSPRLSPSHPRATPKGSHLAEVHPAVPSPMPARAMPAARTPEKTFFGGEKPRHSQAPAPKSTGWRLGAAPPS